MYRVCQVQGEAYGVVYQECSTENGASGAGVYMQVYDLEINDWDRVVSINWCDSLAGRKRNSASEASQAWPGGEKGLFPPPGHVRLFTPLHLEACSQATGVNANYLFSVSWFSPFCLQLVGIQNTKYSKKLTGKQLSVTLWLTENVLRILCSWTSKSRYSLCNNR